MQINAGFNGTRIYFADQPNLRDKQIEKIEIYVQGVGYAPSGLPNNAQTSTYLTLSNSDGNEFMQNISTLDILGIMRLQGSGTFNGTFTFAPTKVVFTKSFLSFINGHPTPLANGVIMFGVYYK